MKNENIKENRKEIKKRKPKEVACFNIDGRKKENSICFILPKRKKKEEKISFPFFFLRYLFLMQIFLSQRLCLILCYRLILNKSDVDGIDEVAFIAIQCD